MWWIIKIVAGFVGIAFLVVLGISALFVVYRMRGKYSTSMSDAQSRIDAKLGRVRINEYVPGSSSMMKTIRGYGLKGVTVAMLAIIATVVLITSGATVFDAHRLYHFELGHLLLALALPAALILGARAFGKRQELMLMLGAGVGAYLAAAFLIGWLTPDDGGCSPSAHCHLATGADGSTASVSIPKGMTFCFDDSFWKNAARLHALVSYQGGAERAFSCSRREVETDTCAESIGDSVRFTPEKGTPPPSYWFVPEKDQCDG